MRALELYVCIESSASWSCSVLYVLDGRADYPPLNCAGLKDRWGGQLVPVAWLAGQERQEEPDASLQRKFDQAQVITVQ